MLGAPELNEALRRIEEIHNRPAGSDETLHDQAEKAREIANAAVTENMNRLGDLLRETI